MKVLGAEAEVPELPSLPDGEANNVQSVAVDPLLDDAGLRARLRELPGVGRWTAEYVAMRALGDPDAFPAGDLHLRRKAGNCTERELERRSESWRPWRAYATLLLWQGGLDDDPMRRPPASTAPGRRRACRGRQAAASAQARPSNKPQDLPLPLRSAETGPAA